MRELSLGGWDFQLLRIRNLIMYLYVLWKCWLLT
jgi:hypothetical protein